MGVALEFFAKLADEDAKVFRLLRGLCAPDRGEKDAVGEHFAGIAREEQEQVELLGREVDEAASDGNAVRGWIDEKVAHLNGAVTDALRCASQMGADAGEEFLDVEGFGDVIIGAGVESFDLGVFLVANRENQDGNGGLSADGAAEFNAGHAGHHQVGDDEVGLPVLEDAHGFLGVVHGAHIVALSRERGAQHARDLNFVVNDQDAFGHVRLLRRFLEAP
jgi:hypothetical protein